MDKSPWASFEVIESNILVNREQIHFPRSKKKRIKKKWMKKPENWVTKPSTEYYVVNIPGVPLRIICHPKLAQALRERITSAPHHP